MKALMITFSLFTLIHTSIASADGIISTVLVVKGNVKVKEASGAIVELKPSMGITEGSYIKTEKNSYVKLVFIDRSYMTVGPDSLIRISQFSTKAAGIISLVRGQIRSQVTKNYMEFEDKTKSKLFIKTKTAAMGIRGTDFQVNFDSDSKKTQLITFEGKVVMNRLAEDSKAELSQSQLDKLLEGKERVLVAKGYSSEISNDNVKAFQPYLMEKNAIASLNNSLVPLPKAETRVASDVLKNKEAEELAKSLGFNDKLRPKSEHQPDKIAEVGTPPEDNKPAAVARPEPAIATSVKEDSKPIAAAASVADAPIRENPKENTGVAASAKEEVARPPVIKEEIKPAIIKEEIRPIIKEEIKPIIKEEIKPVEREEIKPRENNEGPKPEIVKEVIVQPQPEEKKKLNFFQKVGAKIKSAFRKKD